MINFKKIAAICMATLCTITGVACTNQQKEPAAKHLDLEREVTVNVWYNDDTYTKYLDYVSKQFNNDNELVKINPVLVSEPDYLQYIYDESIRNDNACDVYLCSSDNLEEVYLRGLALPNTEFDKVYTEDIYGKAGLEASSYNEQLYGYPVTFDTAAFCYNKKYAEAVSSISDIPSTDMEQLKTVDGLAMPFAYDTGNFMTNFPFIGKYISFEGNSIDNTNIYINDEASFKNSLTEYQKLRDRYGLARDAQSASSYLDLFKQNKLAYGIFKASEIVAIDKTVDFGVSEVPGLTADLTSKSLSTTTMAIVNPYTQDIDCARAVAKAISYDYAANITPLTGLATARGDVSKDANLIRLHEIYSNSMVKPVYTGIDEIFAQYEIMLHKIWDQEDVNTAYDSFKAVVSKYTKTNAE
jgi:maltose-binding protein MalE